jgi:hypothetical protein
MTRDRKDWELRLKSAMDKVSSDPTPIQMDRMRSRLAARQGASKDRIAMVAGAVIVALFVLVISGRQWFIQDTTGARAMSDQQLLDIVGAQTQDPAGEIIYRQQWGENGVVLFTRFMRSESKEMDWKVDYIKTSVTDASSVVSGGIMTIPLPTKGEVEQGVRMISKFVPYHEESPFPMAYGDLMNPHVAQIRLIDQNGNSTATNIVKNVSGGHSLWFAYLHQSSEAGILTIECLDREGQLIETYSLE